MHSVSIAWVHTGKLWSSLRLPSSSSGHSIAVGSNVICVSIKNLQNSCLCSFEPITGELGRLFSGTSRCVCNAIVRDHLVDRVLIVFCSFEFPFFGFNFFSMLNFTELKDNLSLRIK